MHIRREETMDYIVNGNIKLIVEAEKKREENSARQPILKKANVNAYSKALRRISVKGGGR